MSGLRRNLLKSEVFIFWVTNARKQEISEQKVSINDVAFVHYYWTGCTIELIVGMVENYLKMESSNLLTLF